MILSPIAVGADRTSLAARCRIAAVIRSGDLHGKEEFLSRHPVKDRRPAQPLRALFRGCIKGKMVTIGRGRTATM